MREGAGRVTPALVQAAEAVLRGALEPAVAVRPEEEQADHAWQASPRNETLHNVLRLESLGSIGPLMTAEFTALGTDTLLTDTPYQTDLREAHLMTLNKVLCRYLCPIAFHI